MANKLTAMIRDELSKSKDGMLGQEADVNACFSTGLDLLDFFNGKRMEKEDGEEWFSTGIEAGTFISVIGPSGSGKSTLATTIAKNIVEPYENAQIFYKDIENGLNKARIKALTKWDDETIEEKFIHQNIGISVERLYAQIKKVAQIKIENREEFSVEMEGQYDKNGNTLRVLVPTVFIIDSVALLTPDNIAEEDEMSGSMSASAIAKANNAFFKRVMQTLKEANIILIGINHITQKIEINPMMHTKAAINYLKQGESIPGGTSSIYLANNIIRVEPGSKLTDDKEYGINGFLTEITMVKTRTNRAGRKFCLVFNQEKGFNNTLSNYNYIKTEKLIGGAGRSFYLLSEPDIKFAQKDFIKKLRESKPLRKAYWGTMDEIMENIIPSVEDLVSTDDEVFRDDEDYEMNEEIVENDYDEEDEDEVVRRPKKKKKRPVIDEDDDEEIERPIKKKKKKRPVDDEDDEIASIVRKKKKNKA